MLDTYNTQLQTNITSFQKALEIAKTLPIKTPTDIQKWTCELMDGKTVDKYIEIPRMCTIKYDLGEYVTSSNTATQIKQGEPFETTLSSGTSGNYMVLDKVYVYHTWNGVKTKYEFSPDNEAWLVHIEFPAEKTIGSDTYPDVQIEIEVCLSGAGAEEW